MQPFSNRGVYVSMIKRIIVLMHLALVCTFAQAQLLKPKPGTSWVYNYSKTGEYSGHVKLEYDRDTVVNGDTVVYLSHILYRNNMDSVYRNPIQIKYSDSVVLIGTMTGFDTLYNFKAKVNDSWTHNSSSAGPIKVTVKSIGDGGVYGKTLNLEYRSVNDEVVGDLVYERGSRGDLFFLPWDIFDGYLGNNVGGAWRCYADDQYEEVSPSWQLKGLDCEAFTLGVKGSGDLIYSTYPNPTNGILNLAFPVTVYNARLELVDSHGKVIILSEVTGNEYMLDMNECSGIYYIKLTTSSGITSIVKVVKY